MKTATFLFFACLLVSVSLQCETPTYVAVIETVEAIPGGAFVKLRPNATTKWVNCLLSEYEDKLAKDSRDKSEDYLDAVNVGDLDMAGGRGSGGIVDLKLTNLTVSGLSRPQIVSAEAEGLVREMTGQVRANVRYDGLRFKALFHSTHHDGHFSSAALKHCSGRLTVTVAEILVEMKFYGRSVDENKLPELDSVTIELLSKPDDLSMTYTVEEPGMECGHSESIIDRLAESCTADGLADFRSQLRAQLEAKLTRNLRLALKAKK